MEAIGFAIIVAALMLAVAIVKAADKIDDAVRYYVDNMKG